MLGWDTAKGGGLGNPARVSRIGWLLFRSSLPWSKATSLGSSCLAGWHPGPVSALRSVSGEAGRE